MATPSRILVVRPDRIGDVVLSTPLVRALRRSFPDAYLAEMVRPYTADVLRGNPHLDEILIDDPGGANAGGAGFARQISALRARRFDTALMLLQSRRHAWMTFLAGIGCRVAVGDKPYHFLTFAHRISRRKYTPLRHEADYCLDLARAVGAQDDGLDTEVFLDDAERAAAMRLVGDGGVLVGIHPGSGASAPNLRPERYVEVASRLLEHPAVRVVLTGGPAERDLASGFTALPAERVVDLVGRLTLRETMAVISHLSVLISASTGTMHIAAALDVPTVSVFCPLPACSPQLWGPQGSDAEILLPPPGYCQTRCPGDPHICDLEGGISPAEVVDAAARFLRREW